MNFKSTSIAFLLSVCLIILLNYFFEISFWWLLFPFLLYNFFLIYGSATIQSNFFAKAFCNSHSSKKEIAITFDDGPDAEYTLRILSLLAEYNVKATFFVIGKNIKNNEMLIKQIDAENHTLGNHTFSHSYFIDFKSKAGFIEEINATSEIVESITGKRMKLFRPPYGVTTPNIAKAVKELNLHIIGWNVRSLDTTKDTEEVILKRVKKQIKAGAVVLFHDTSEKTISVLRQTLIFAKKKGFKIVSLEELLMLESYIE